MSVSVITAFLNEEKNLPELFKNIRGAVDEIIVLDGNSDDRTKEVAESLGARYVLRRPEDWERTSEYCTNYYMALAKNDWILGIDTDERLEEDLKKALKSLASDGRYSAYRFRL